ncbi:MAG: hypothetical protein QM504_04040 [Pseudomonadota bacterium]
MSEVKIQKYNRSEIQKIGALILLFLFSLMLRTQGLDFESLWMDEVRQVSYYKAPFFDMFKYSALQQQPPLDYWIGHLLFLFYDSDFTARLPAAVFGSFSVVLLASLLSRYVNLWLALAVAVIFSLLPFNLYFSQEARPYSIAIFFTLLFIWFIDYLNNINHTKLSHYGILLIITSLYLFTRTLSPLVVVVVSIVFFTMWMFVNVYKYGLVGSRLNKKLFFIIITLILACIIFLPILFKIVSVSSRYAHGGASIGLDFFASGFSHFKILPMWEAYITQTEPLGLIVFFLVASGLSFLIWKQKLNSFLLIFALFLLIGSVFLHSFIFHAKTNFPLRPPYAIYLLPFCCIILALILDNIIQATAKIKNSQMVVKMLLASLFLNTLASSIDFKNKRVKTDWRGLSEYINLTYSSEQLLLFKSFTSEDEWDPSTYGFNRYQQLAGKLNILPMRQYENILLEIKDLPLKPHLIFFQYRDYFLTNHSTYPIMAKPLSDTFEFDFLSILDQKKFKIKLFTGFTIISLKESSGAYIVDAKLLFDGVLKILPQDNSLWDMYRVYAMTLALCGDINYSEIVNIAKKISGRGKFLKTQQEKIRDLYLEARSRNYSCSKKI